MKKILSLIAAFALSFLAVPAWSSPAWYTFTLTSTGTGLGSVTLNYLGDLTWTPQTALPTIANCTAQGLMVVRHDYGGKQFYSMLVGAQMKALAVGNSIAVKVYIDDTSFSTGCDSSSGYPSFTSMQVLD